jgi:hypothetical protein
MVALEEVDNTQGQRVVGADHGEIGPVFLGEPEQTREVVGADGDATDFLAAARATLRRDAGIARGAPKPVRVGGAGKLPNQRVLAAARPDDEELHRPPIEAVARRAAKQRNDLCPINLRPGRSTPASSR